MSLQVEIGYPDGSREARTFDVDQVVVGRGPRADFDVQLARELDEEHLLLVPRRGGCWVATAAGVRVQPTLAGKPFEHGLVPWGTELDVGSVTVKIRRPAATRRGALQWYVLGLAPLAAAAYLLWPRGDAMLGTPVRAPELALMAPRCDDDKAPLARARQKSDIASALADRYPYDAREGLRAAQLWADAGACFEAAQQAASAAAASERGAAMLARVIEDYKAQLLVLEQARRRGDERQVLGSVRVLQRFLADSPGAYLDYLGRLERQALLSLEKKNKHVKYKS